jgi:cell wall assembly regulator SMI1
MEATELGTALEAHGGVLEAQGFEVEGPAIEPPATKDEVDAVEAELGFELPGTFRRTLEDLSRSVSWSWTAPGEVLFPEPFRQVWSGHLEWSLASLVECHHGYMTWVEQVFPDAGNSYDAVWHRKLGFATAANGDVLSVDLDPERLGEVVYLSHDDGQGHGYTMARSLMDLVERWVPLACPGPEDWQWLPFVPYDFGPLDPACDNAVAWRAVLGLQVAPARTRPSEADDQLFHTLMATYRSSPGSTSAAWAARRAVRVCSTARAHVVIELLHSESMILQEEAAKRLATWQWEPAVPHLAEVALRGSHNGRIAAMAGLREMSGGTAAAARADLRRRLPKRWSTYLGDRG